MKICLKVIDVKIVEKDFSEVVEPKNLTLDEVIEEIKEQYKFENDKTEMYKRIREVKNKI